MNRSLSTLAVFLLSLATLHPHASAVVREWDGEGITLDWSEADNWSDNGVPDTTDDALIGSLPAAFDTTVIFDLNADRVLSLTLENGADLDLDGGRLLMDVDGTIGAGAASGATISELIVHKRPGTSSGAIAIDANRILVGANGKLSLIDGAQIEFDGTGLLPGTLTIADGGELVGYGQIALTDTDASLGSLTSLIANEGSIVIEDPLFTGIGEPTAVQLQVTTPDAPMFAQLDLGGAGNSGLVSLTRNATLQLEQPFLGPNRLTMFANTTLAMPQAGTIASGQTIEINSGLINAGGVNELPAAPAMITGGGLLSISGIIRVNEVDEELIVETPIDAIGGLIMNEGTVRLRGGGNLREVDIDDSDLGSFINESTAVLEFQGGQNYETGLTNAGSMGIFESEGDATVTLKAFEQTDAGTLSVDLGGDAAGDFDVLSVVNDIVLDGVLNVALTMEFEPALGDSFTILDSQTGSLTGQFATTNLPELGEGTFEVVYNASSVELQVVGMSSTPDFDMDGDVDASDFLAWQRGESPDPLSAEDLAAWQAAYNSPPAIAAIPEPATLISIAVAACLLTSRRQGCGC